MRSPELRIFAGGLWPGNVKSAQRVKERCRLFHRAHVARRLSCALAACLLTVLLAPAALAAKPLTQKQYTEQTAEDGDDRWAKKNVKGLEIGSATCVLPLNGNVVHCTVTSTAPSYQEKIVFKVRETLHDERDDELARDREGLQRLADAARRSRAEGGRARDRGRARGARSRARRDARRSSSPRT